MKKLLFKKRSYFIFYIKKFLYMISYIMYTFCERLNMKNKKKKIFGILLLILICGTSIIFGVTNSEYGGDEAAIDITESTIKNNLVLDYIGQFIFAIGNIFQSVTSWIMGVFTGKSVFPWADKVIFNTIPLLDVNFINPDPTSLFSLTNELGIGEIIRNIYFTALSISLGFMGIIIAVLAIRLAISSIGSEKAKYKEAITTWATSLVLLFGMHYFISFMFYMNEELVIVASKILNNTIEESGAMIADIINEDLDEKKKTIVENFISSAGESEIGASSCKTLRDNYKIAYLLINDSIYKENLNMVSGNNQSNFFEKVAIAEDNVINAGAEFFGKDYTTVAGGQGQLLAKSVNAIVTATKTRETESSDYLFQQFMDTYNGMNHSELVWQVQNNFIGDYAVSEAIINEVNATESETNPYPDNWLTYIRNQGVSVPDYNAYTDEQLLAELEKYERESIQRLKADSLTVYENTVNRCIREYGEDSIVTITYKYALKAVKGELNLDAGDENIISNLGEYFKQTAWTIDEDNKGWSPTQVSVVSAILYTIFVFQSISFFISYMKRLFMVVVLAILAPFVVIYEFFKKSTFGASKGGIMNSWLRELCTLIFVQTFQAFLLAIIMSIIVRAIAGTYASSMDGGIEAVGLLAIFALLSLPKLELLVKNIFGLTSGVADTSLARGQRSLTAGGLLATRAASRLLDNPKKVVRGARKMLGSAAAKYNDKKSKSDTDDDEKDEESRDGNNSSISTGRINREIGSSVGALGIGGDSGLSSAIQSLTDAVNTQNNIMNSKEFSEKSEKSEKYSGGGKEFLTGIAETIASVPGAIAGATISAGFNKNAVEGAIVGAGVGDKVGETVVNVAAEIPSTAKDSATVIKGVAKDIAGLVTSNKKGSSNDKNLKENTKKTTNTVINNVNKTTNVKNTNTIQTSGTSTNSDELVKKVSEEISSNIQKELDGLKKEVDGFKKNKTPSGVSKDDSKEIGKQISDSMKKNSKNNRLNNKKIIDVDDL